MMKYKKYLIIGGIASACSLIVFIVLYFAVRITVLSLDSQYAAERWRSDDLRYSQLSAFISEDAGFNVQAAEYTELSLIERIAEDSYASAGGERVVITNSISQTEMIFSSDTDTVESSVYYTDYDHFIFHPHFFTSGWHYNGDELMKNYIVINEELAFRLFGGTNVAGMTVNASGDDCVIIGVTSGPVSDAEKKLWDKNEPVAYIMHGFSDKYDEQLPITCFEVLIPNPVKDYASAIFENAMHIEEIYVELIENTGRGKYFSLVKRAFSSDKDMMKYNTVYYPYWENAARKVYSDIKTVVVVSAVFAAVPIIYVFSLIVLLFVNKEKLFKALLDFVRNKFDSVKRNKKRRKTDDEKESNTF